MTTPVTTALIGCGKVGRAHALALATLPRSRLVAVTSANPDRAAAFAHEFDARAYPSVEAMLERERPQVVSICTPHPSHAALVELCAAAGAHVLVEKPLAPDLVGCDRAIAACRTAGVQLGVISQRRLYAPVRRLHQAIQDGRIGRPVLAVLTVLGWRDEPYYRMDAWRGRWDTEGGGVLVNQTPHQLDLLRWLMGPIEELYGYWDNLNHPYVEVEDTAVAVIRFRSGALGSVVLSNSQKPGLYGKLHVHGSTGASIGVQTEGGSPFVAGVDAAVDPPVNDLWTVPGDEGLLSVWQAHDRSAAAGIDVTTYYHRLQIEDFLDSVCEDRPPMVDGQAGREVVEMITAIYRSQRDGHPVRFPLQAEAHRSDYDGRLGYLPLSRRAPVGRP